MGVRCLLAATLAFGATAAAEPDGATAAASRWTGPDGPASNSRRSRAMPVVRDVVEAWALPLRGPALAPPVLWDGFAYVLASRAGAPELVCVDVRDGRLVASKMFPDASEAPIHVWNGIVYVTMSDTRIEGHRVAGGGFVKKHENRGLELAGGGVVVWENEIYAVSGWRLMKLQPGRTQPVWTLPTGCFGTPAVYGDNVLVLGRHRDGEVTLHAVERWNGVLRSFAPVAPAWGNARAHVTVGDVEILAALPGRVPTDAGDCTHAFVPFAFDPKTRGVLVERALGFWNFRIQPAACRDGFLSYDGRAEWQRWRKGRGLTLATRTYSPDLFQSLVPATVLGDVAYFGTWAADVETGEVLWRLPLRAVRFGAVPADRLVIVIDGSDVLRAYRSRVGG